MELYRAKDDFMVITSNLNSTHVTMQRIFKGQVFLVDIPSLLPYPEEYFKNKSYDLEEYYEIISFKEIR